jgi:hypothetical protein
MFILFIVLGACQRGDADGSSDVTETDTGAESTATDHDVEIGAWVDDWEQVGSGPAAGLELLSIGNRGTNDNFSNRGDIEVNYVEGIDVITIEMQRFTIGEMDSAEDAFGRMHPWLYDLPVPEPPEILSPDNACWAPGTTACYVQAYFDGLFQPVRDGANFRITIPAGWSGSLELVTADNLEDARYPDRSDILVDGLAGPLSVDLDSGNVAVRLDPNLPHYAGCPDNDACVAQDHAPGCGCVEPTDVSIVNRAPHASNMTVDVGNVDHWYSVTVENRNGPVFEGPACEALVDCSPFAECQLDPDFEESIGAAQAEINYPGDPAIAGAGIQITLISQRCADVPHVNDPEDWDNPNMPIEQRGHLLVCAGCL